MTLSHGLQYGQSRPAHNHVIFSVNLKPKTRIFNSQQRIPMLGLCPKTCTQLRRGCTVGLRRGRHRLDALLSVCCGRAVNYMAFNMPMPLGVVMVVQVPAATYFQALA